MAGREGVHTACRVRLQEARRNVPKAVLQYMTNLKIERVSRYTSKEVLQDMKGLSRFCVSNSAGDPLWEGIECCKWGARAEAIRVVGVRYYLENVRLRLRHEKLTNPLGT